MQNCAFRDGKRPFHKHRSRKGFPVGTNAFRALSTSAVGTPLRGQWSRTYSLNRTTSPLRSARIVSILMPKWSAM